MTPTINTPVAALYDTILILDFGSQYTHLIARRIRELGVYCELLACTTKIADIPFKPKGVILSGSPYSVYADGSPHVDPAVWDLKVPVLGICYGLQEIAFTRGGKVTPSEKKERVWMSHGDQVSFAPEGFKTTATTSLSPFAAVERTEDHIYGIQFHPEATFVDKEIERIRSIVGPAQVIGAVSGGVDSTVAAKIMSIAIGDRFHAILVDNGVMRLNECATVVKTLQEHLKINLTLADASELFMGRLKGVIDPEKKRKIIGNTFIEVFEAEAAKIESAVEHSGKGKIEYLLQGTLYPDVIESISFKGPSATIKTHHNVGGLLDDMKLQVIELLRELFKGEVTTSQVDIVRHADFIFIEEIKKAGLYRKISQAYAALLPIRSVGVMRCSYLQAGHCSSYFMTADWFEMPYDILKRISTRIINEVNGVNRVVYDVSSKPPATIEWE
ncbi:GMP synthase (glutamine-hydrolyzing) domain-containing protein [Batrachochytrium salamandrivorans]|nr:GMP synthase (glutamine-hydrolyzing) domain-containing protein [Batrachochytrium salamandrivorans]